MPAQKFAYYDRLSGSRLTVYGRRAYPPSEFSRRWSVWVITVLEGRSVLLEVSDAEAESPLGPSGTLFVYVRMEAATILPVTVEKNACPEDVIDAELMHRAASSDIVERSTVGRWFRPPRLSKLRRELLAHLREQRALHARDTRNDLSGPRVPQGKPQDGRCDKFYAHARGAGLRGNLSFVIAAPLAGLRGPRGRRGE
jgi:hypothetical protein